MDRFLLTCSSILVFLTGFAQQEDSLFIRRLADEVLLNSKAYDNLHTLTKTIGGRLSGSPQLYKAEAWGQRALLNAGADKVYLQECMVPHWVRGGKDSAVWQTLKNNTELKLSSLDILAIGN